MSDLPEGFIPHDGGPCPVSKTVAVPVIIRAGIHGVVTPHAIGWEWGSPPSSDIIAYKPEVPMTINLIEHANAILRAAATPGLNSPPWSLDARWLEERKAILAACAALFDAGARAMQERAAGHADMHSYSAGRDIRSIEPASLRSE
jgi:hypothetical protein